MVLKKLLIDGKAFFILTRKRKCDLSIDKSDKIRIILRTIIEILNELKSASCN